MHLLPGYEIGETVGEGGMSSVYKGIQSSLGRPVAIKFLSESLFNHKEAREFFDRESYIIAQLNHPNIIHVIDRGVTDQGVPYFVMELVEGVSLKQVIKRKDLSLNRRIDIIVQICKGLSYAHKNGVIHRDIKPANILVDMEGHVRVLDFGIAFIGAGATQFERSEPREEPEGVLGTLNYISPEQKNAPDSVTLLADLYSLGIMMYELVTGYLPPIKYRPPSNFAKDIPEALDELIAQCLEEDPFKRPASADEVKDKLLALLRGAHLNKAQKDRAGAQMKKIAPQFELLDVIKDDQYGAVYLQQEKHTGELLIIKKKNQTDVGFKEAKLLSSLKHKHIIDIAGVSKNERAFIIVLEYLNGGSLQNRLLQRYTISEITNICKQVCAALSFAHKNRIMHGNLRPSNILFDENDKVKVTDFGLEEHYSQGEAYHNWYHADALGEKTPQQDIFSLGAIIYHLLVGEPIAYENNILQPHEFFASLPKELQEIVQKMLSLNPGYSYQHIDDVSRDIHKFELNRHQMSKAAKDAEDETIICRPPPKHQRIKRKKAMPLWLVGFITITLTASAGVAAIYYFLPNHWKRIASAFQQLF